jgi:hypothetical protein
MSEIRTAPVATALLAKGFMQASGNRDHDYFFFRYQGKKTSVFTRISHGERSADDWLIGKMAQQVKLTKREFLALVECTLSGPAYCRLLVERGHVR